MTNIRLAEAIEQLRNELRSAVLEGRDKDIVFSPTSIELELSVNFSVETEAGGKLKLLTFLDLSADARMARESQHKIRLELKVLDRNGKPIEIMESGGLPAALFGKGDADAIHEH